MPRNIFNTFPHNGPRSRSLYYKIQSAYRAYFTHTHIYTCARDVTADFTRLNYLTRHYVSSSIEYSLKFLFVGIFLNAKIPREGKEKKQEEEKNRKKKRSGYKHEQTFQRERKFHIINILLEMRTRKSESTDRSRRTRGIH